MALTRYIIMKNQGCYIFKVLVFIYIYILLEVIKYYKILFDL